MPDSTGLGTLEASRGGEHVVDPSTGDVLVGERDAQGAPGTAQRGRRRPHVGRPGRKGGVWNGHVWTTDKWKDGQVQAAAWPGSSWSGISWAAHEWSDASWQARSWRNGDWQARSWREATWLARSWRDSDLTMTRDDRRKRESSAERRVWQLTAAMAVVAAAPGGARHGRRPGRC